jgi:hypothetical protein
VKQQISSHLIANRQVKDVKTIITEHLRLQGTRPLTKVSLPHRDELTPKAQTHNARFLPLEDKDVQLDVVRVEEGCPDSAGQVRQS